MEQETLTKLANATRSMRSSQKAYFKYRTPEHLKDSKDKEALVDKLLNLVDQKSLF
jgi:hypothetical protein